MVPYSYYRAGSHLRRMWVRLLPRPRQTPNGSRSTMIRRSRIMAIFISVLVLVSPLWYAALLISPLSRRTKIVVAVITFVLLVSLPLVFIIFSPELGL